MVQQVPRNLSGTGAWKEALQAIGIALSIRQNDAASLDVKGLAHANLKQGREAQAALDKARAIDTKLYLVQYPFGGVLYLSLYLPSRIRR